MHSVPGKRFPMLRQEDSYKTFGVRPSVYTGFSEKEAGFRFFGGSV
ncbi:hypothetical protein LEP1GSC185_0910 [Leptospira licerasiae serovar Varillal str. VAR 010]|uniref:Uncharacterized protein n=1 Tax=Leptospira licerasiae str. MMD4847 TaxID=1049971 RepID=A0ABP2RG76_9LEPT|nr:hypothetical protein LEP1GSC185_0910 [Leptospira licerasiae serovar Varillal str. VAR 010]EJZ43420.1 hypothetical protein LEP1GSC178_3641 [Leptospira licerasiae str. MMD4847]